jgi:hypothetical protein
MPNLNHSPLRMLRRLALSASVIFIAGCAAPSQRLSPPASLALKGKALAVASREVPSFAAMTAGKAMFAALGALAMHSEGDKIVATNNVADPAGAVARDIAATLANVREVQLVAPPLAVKTTDAAELAVLARDKAQLLLDVQTTYWAFAYFPTNWTRYRVMYFARARLIDTRSGEVLGSASCKRTTDDEAGAPTYDELLANEAAVLKQKLQTAGAECAKTMKAELL